MRNLVPVKVASDSVMLPTPADLVEYASLKTLFLSVSTEKVCIKKYHAKVHTWFLNVLPSILIVASVPLMLGDSSD